jgi:hypothetical protein
VILRLDHELDSLTFMADLETAYSQLWKICRQDNFAGYDPFDGLNSSRFQATPLNRSRAARLLWTQFFKRSPINLRELVGIKPERNSKGIALFALSALARYRTTSTKEDELEALELLDDLMSMRITGLKGAAWGYNFDWQGRAFFAPRGTPTIVPTAFAARALIEAAETLNQEYLGYARTVCDFILNDLNRSGESSDEVCFSYSPLDQTRVFNASLLAGEILAVVGRLSNEPTLCEWAMRTARFVIRRQRQDGSWAYGADGYQSWADNFHTGFILNSLSRIIDSCEGAGDELEPSLVRGYEFWRERFFLTNGWPKYYPDSLYPADSHSAGAALVTLAELHGRIPGTLLLADKVAQWSIENLQRSNGYFCYQRRRFYRNRIPYMRWSQAWMAYGLARVNQVKRQK